MIRKYLPLLAKLVRFLFSLGEGGGLVTEVDNGSSKFAIADKANQNIC